MKRSLSQTTHFRSSGQDTTLCGLDYRELEDLADGQRLRIETDDNLFNVDCVNCQRIIWVYTRDTWNIGDNHD